MKHSATRDFYAHWDEQRGEAKAPDRAALDLEPIRHLLADTFVLSFEAPLRLPVRVAGTRVAALIGAELKGRDFLDFWQDDSRDQLADLAAITKDESLATVAGATAQTNRGTTLFLELLLLPFASRSYTQEAITGLMVPLTQPGFVGHETVTHFTLTTWRHQGHQNLTLRQRAVRRLALAKGLMVYEGLVG
ncbi:MAG: PAS domain-containing protein [Hyphomicrobiales bacterium]|nr:MAG: PAS domain-containing protein [Hyphomicrobiales bacterium]